MMFRRKDNVLLAVLAATTAMSHVHAGDGSKCLRVTGSSKCEVAGNEPHLTYCTLLDEAGDEAETFHACCPPNVFAGSDGFFFDFTCAALGTNPTEFKGFMLDLRRDDFLGQETTDPDDTCGQTCRGPDVYPLGFVACLRTTFEQDDGSGIRKVMPKVVLSNDANDLGLPKVVFSPSTSFDSSEFKIAEYDAARVGFATASRLPAAVLYAETTADVVHGVNCARINGYTVASRGRGHDFGQGVSLEGSLVIDVQLNCKVDAFDQLHNDPKYSRKDHIGDSHYIGKMRVPSGCTNAVFLTAADKHFGGERGMMVVGSCPSVGVTGYFLNGGYGDQTPYNGLASDVVDEIEMVLYNGTTITATKDNEWKDIFWASKGGTGGIGVITSFVARIIQNPHEKFTAVTFNYNSWNVTDEDELEKEVEIVERFQTFLSDNFESKRFGGTTSNHVLGGFGFTGTFLGNITQMLKVFSNDTHPRNNLLDKELVQQEERKFPVVVPGSMLSDQSMVYATDSNPEGGCDGGETCQSKYGTTFPLFRMHVSEWKTQAEVQAIAICLAVSNGIFARTLSVIWVHRTLNICHDLGIKDEYCDTFAGTIGSHLKASSCHDSFIVKKFIEAARDPKSFLNRKGASVEVLEFFSDLDNVKGTVVTQPNMLPNPTALDRFAPNPKALGSTSAGGWGTGGMILPKLQRLTIKDLIQKVPDEKFTAAHLVHGAPLLVSPIDDGYPHRNAFWNTPNTPRSITYMNILLEDPAFNNNPSNLQIYGNYNPSGRIPNYENYVYGEKAKELSRIRTVFDPLGGFDSPRYPQRNRTNLERTVDKTYFTDSPTSSLLDECIAALIGTYLFQCCCGGGIYAVDILCNNKYDCTYTERNVVAALDKDEPSKCVFSGTFDAREVIDPSTCDTTKMIAASYDSSECDNEFDLNLPEEKFTTPIGLQIKNMLSDDGTIDISFIRKDSSPKEATKIFSSEDRRVEALRYSDNAEEGHRLLAAASEFEMKALMETHRRYLECEDDVISPTTSPEDADSSSESPTAKPTESPTAKPTESDTKEKSKRSKTKKSKASRASKSDKS